MCFGGLAQLTAKSIESDLKQHLKFQIPFLDSRPNVAAPGSGVLLLKELEFTLACPLLAGAD